MSVDLFTADTITAPATETPTRRNRPARTNERRQAIAEGLGYRRHRTDVRSRWSV